MRHLLYISTATPLADGALDSILASSQHNNVERDITGFLLFNRRNFMQLIEGPEASLMSLMQALGRDPRHQGVTQLVNEEIGERACPDWRMRLISIAEPVGRRTEQVRAELPAALHEPVKTLAVNFATLN